MPCRTLLVQARLERQLPQACRRGLLIDERRDSLAPLARGGVHLTFGLAYLFRLVRREHMCAGTRLVQDIDGLVGKISVGDVALGQGDACTQRILRIVYVVVTLVVGRNVVQYLERLYRRGRLYDHLLEATLKCRVALDVLAELVERSGADGLQLAACQCRFEYVGRVEAALCGSRPDDCVYFVDEDYRVVASAQLVQQLLHTLLEFAAELRPGHERRHVERIDRLVAYGAWYIP